MNHKILCGIVFAVFIATGCDQNYTNEKERITFSVDKVKPAEKNLPEVTADKYINDNFGPVTAFRGRVPGLVDIKIDDLPADRRFFKAGKDYHYNTFAAAIHLAHSQHRPLVLSPDMLWLTIAQGFVRHIKLHPELTEKFYDFTGKKTIRIYRSDVSAYNLQSAPWDDIMSELADKMKKETRESLYGLLVPRYSTTGPLETAAYHVTLLELHENKFNYEVFAVCGIPRITLLGSVEDWSELLARTKKLREYKLEWWIDELVPVLEEIVETRKGSANAKFWRSIYKDEMIYTTTAINGWIIKLFPYITKEDMIRSLNDKNPKFVRSAEKYVRNPYMNAKLDGSNKPGKPDYMPNGIKLEEIPAGLSQTGFLFVDTNHNFTARLRIMAGFIGVSQDKNDRTLRPEIGWVVVKG